MYEIQGTFVFYFGVKATIYTLPNCRGNSLKFLWIFGVFWGVSPSGRSEVAGGSLRRLRDDFFMIVDGLRTATPIPRRPIRVLWPPVLWLLVVAASGLTCKLAHRSADGASRRFNRRRFAPSTDGASRRTPTPPHPPSPRICSFLAPS